MMDNTPELSRWIQLTLFGKLLTQHSCSYNMSAIYELLQEDIKKSVKVSSHGLRAGQDTCMHV